MHTEALNVAQMGQTEIVPLCSLYTNDWSDQVEDVQCFAVKKHHTE